MTDNSDSNNVNVGQEMTKIVELPAIICGGVVTITDASLHNLDDSQLKLLARTMEGQLVYVKRRIQYVELETPLCTRKECWRPAITALGCGDHPQG